MYDMTNTIPQKVPNKSLDVSTFDLGCTRWMYVLSYTIQLLYPWVKTVVEASWNVMAHMQKPDFIFWRNKGAHLNRRGRQFSWLLAAKVSASAFIVGSNAGYTMFWGSVKGTGYPLHSPVSPSLPLPCITLCYHISTGVYSLDGTQLSMIASCHTDMSLGL